VHELVRANNGIDRASLDAKRTPDAVWFIYDGDCQWVMLAAVHIQRNFGTIQ
jgi:hypothetical protein